MSCATTKAIDLGEFNIASVYRFGPVTIQKDGATWNLSSGTVTFKFESPDRSTQTTVAASPLTDGSDGVFYYDCTVTDFTQTGDWTMGITVTDGANVTKFPYEIGFHMNDNP